MDTTDVDMRKNKVRCIVDVLFVGTQWAWWLCRDCNDYTVEPSRSKNSGGHKFLLLKHFFTYFLFKSTQTHNFSFFRHLSLTSHNYRFIFISISKNIKQLQNIYFYHSGCKLIELSKIATITYCHKNVSSKFYFVFYQNFVKLFSFDCALQPPLKLSKCSG